MRLTPIAAGISRAYGRTAGQIASAAWMWFEWDRDPKSGALVRYRWKF